MPGSGAAATSLVDEDEIEVYFGVMLLGAVAVAIRTIGEFAAVPVLAALSLLLILGAAARVAGAVVTSVRALRADPEPMETGSTAD